MAQFKFLLGAHLSLSGTVAEGRMPPPLPHPSARREGSQEHEGSREGGAWAGRGGEDDVVLVSIRGFREPRKQL